MNFGYDAYVRENGSTERVTEGLVDSGSPCGSGGCSTFDWVVSDDGERVLWVTIDRITADDTDSSWDVFERSSGVTTRVSTGPTGGNHPDRDFAQVYEPALSPDGSRAFSS